MKRYLGFCFAVVALSETGSFADHGKGSVAGRTLSGTTLHQGSASLSTGVTFTNERGFSDQQLLGFAAQGRDVHNSDRSFEYFIGAGYGVTDDFTLSVSLPFIRNTGFRAGTPDGDFETADVIQGLGDATLTGKLRVWSNGLDVALIGGLKIPTGATEERNDRGDLLDPDHQPGTGSWDPIFGVAATWREERLTISSSAVLRVTQKGARGFTAGNVLTLSAAGQYQLTPLGDYPRVWATLEASYIWRGQDRTLGVVNPDSGGGFLLVAPGVKVELVRNVSAGLSVGLPIYQGLNGDQHEDRFEILFGITVDFKLFDQRNEG